MDNVLERRALKKVTKFMSASRDFRRRYEERAMKYLGEYLNSRSVKSNPLQRANLKLPYAFNIIESFTPQIVETFLKEKPYISAVGRGPEDVETADRISSYFSYQLDQMKFLREFIGFVKNCFIYGTAVAKTPWRHEEGEVIQRYQDRDAMGLPVWKKKEVLEVKFDGPAFDNIDFLDFYPDPTANKPGDIQSMRACCHRVYRYLEDLEAMKKKGDYGLYENLDKLKQGMDNNGYDAWGNMNSAPTDQTWADTQRSYLLHQDPGVKTKGKIELWEWWGLFEFEEGKGLEPAVITVANGNVVLRCDRNPFDYKFKPFVACVDYLVPNEFYGMGEVEVTHSMMKEATALRNARLDQANQAVNGMYIVDRSSGINLRNLYSRTGGVIFTNDMNGIKNLPVSEVPGSSYREISQIDYDIQNASGLTNAAQGSSNIGKAFGNTAKGIAYLESYMASRLSLKAKQIEEWCMQEYGQILLLLNRQFVNQQQWVKLYNNEDNPFVMISPDMFYKNYDFYTTGAMERLNRQQRQNMLTSVIIPYLQTAEKYQPFTIKMDALTKRFFKEFEFQNVNELINTPEERERLVAQSQQQQQQSQLQQIQLQTEQQMALQNNAQKAKMERDAQNAENKQHLVLMKGVVDAGVNAVGRSSGE
jgi:hypothetical protein